MIEDEIFEEKEKCKFLLLLAIMTINSDFSES